ncbi:MAG: ABC transporter substrate-binding protein [Dehalococcoidia bacterium]
MRLITPWRLMYAALALIAVVFFAGCSDDDAEFEPATAGELVVATSLPAPGFWNGDSVENLSGGFEYRVAQALAEEFGLQLRVIDVVFDRINAGDFGGADLAISQLAATAERGARMTFTDPYFWSANGVLVKTGTRLSDLDAARRARWVVEAGTIHVAFVADVIRPSQPATVARSNDEMLAALRSGQADAASMDLLTALATAATFKGEFEVVAQFATSDVSGIALPKGSKNVDAVNIVLRRLQDDGDLDRFMAEELTPLLGRDPSTVPTIAVP